MLNVEFFAFIFLIVYIGAIAILFLFMVMTLDIKITNISQKIQDFFSYKSFIVLILLLNTLLFLHEDLFLFYTNIPAESNVFLHQYTNYSKFLKWETPLEILGKALFKEYIISFLFCGFILFITMIGAIVITVEDNLYKTIKQQDPVLQALKIAENSVFNFKMYPKVLYKKF